MKRLALLLTVLSSGCSSLIFTTETMGSGWSAGVRPLEGANMDLRVLCGQGDFIDRNWGDHRPTAPWVRTLAGLDLLPSLAVDVVFLPYTAPASLADRARRARYACAFRHLARHRHTEPRHR